MCVQREACDKQCCVLPLPPLLRVTQFLSVEQHVNGLLEKVPRFVESCRDFQSKAEDISQRYLVI